jgi:hypothetical protein
MWIGKSDPNDVLDLATIRIKLHADAKELHDILEDGKVPGLLRIRSEASALSKRAQRSFKRLSIAAVAATAIATLTSGLLLYGAGSDVAMVAPKALQEGAPASSPPTAPAAAASIPIEQALVSWVKDHRTDIIILQIVSLFVSAVAAGVLASQGLIARWAENRNKAELLRRAVFNDVLTQAQEKLKGPIAVPDPGNPVCQALEFFRRYQHELQITFYARGWVRHDKAVGVFTWLTAVLAGLAAITGVVGALGGSALVLSAFLGIAVPILLSAAQSWRAMSRDSDKAAAYAKAKAALEEILLDIGAVRKKAELGDAAAVSAYVDSVHLIMTTENDAWKPAVKA